MKSVVPTSRYGLPISLSLVFWALALYAARSTSMVIDEGMHLASGYSILRTGDYRLVEEHPPFAKIWAAFPLLFVPDIPDPRGLPAWEEALRDRTESVPLLGVAQQIITSYQPIDRLVLPARAMTALLGLLLGATVYRWAADLGGKWAGALALFLLALDPNLLAHASVAGTDLGAATTTALALFLFARWLRRPTAARWLGAGLALGLALGTKTSALLLVPVVLLVGLLAHPRRWGSLLGLFVLAGLTLWALYGFEFGPIPGTAIPAPAPSHAIPFLRLRRHMADGHPAFLLGENRTHGWWYYFPLAFALKTPLPTQFVLVLALIAAAVFLSRRPGNFSRLVRRWGPVVLFPLLYGAITLTSPLNIGYRHLLPVLPCLLVLAGYGIRSTKCVLRIAYSVPRIPYSVFRAAVGVLLAWLALGTLRVAPHYLAYFNELAGGPDNGWRYLADSNTDWGQGYKDLARFQHEKGLEKVYLSAFIPTYDPALYGVQYEPLTPMWGYTPAVFPSRFNPPPGDYVISATTLDGIPLVDPEMYDWFRKREPDARIAHVLFYYHIPPQDPAPEWVAQCAAPLAPLTPEAITEGFGRDDLRQAEFDCTQAWLYPGGGDPAGWYVLPREIAVAASFAQEHLALSRLSYEQKRRGALPPFRIYEWRAGTPVLDSAALLLPEGASSPVPLDGPLAFLGTRVRSEGDGLEVETWWQVTEGPITRPLSIMGHLLNEAGEVIGEDDGLGVSPVLWQPGDIIVQRHRFPLPPEGEELWLRTGVYWLDTMERWPIAGSPQTDMLLIPLTNLPKEE
ncbi:MAG: glycosyltransferase family 39 protein [Thermoflexales bacterium]|nr:glycosyltransferase family 39 protein [Thermoflexales bacterium]